MPYSQLVFFFFCLKSFQEKTKLTMCAGFFQMIDKKVMFGFWSSFIPDVGLATSTPQLQQSLFTAILKDPSPRVRIVLLISRIKK